MSMQNTERGSRPGIVVWLEKHEATQAAKESPGHISPDGKTTDVSETGALSVLNSPLWAGRAIFTSTAPPDAAQGKEGDLWIRLLG